MKSLVKLASMTLASLMLVFGIASADTSTVAVSGYDLVSYHSDGGPVRGTGNHVAEYDGATYLFASAENLEAFNANPAKYVPAYGGYCAFGVSKGKKFVSDPTVWKVVDGTLYLNLNKKVQGIWSKDVPGNIDIANGEWTSIKNTPASEL